MLTLSKVAPKPQVALPLLPWIIEAQPGSGVTSNERADLEWWQQAPPVLMPVPAVEAGPLKGKRVVVVDADRGLWLYEQRAVTEPHVRNGVPVIGVLDEAAYYLSQDEPDAVVVPRSQPLDTLWVEKPVDVGNTSPIPPAQDDLAKSARTKSLVVDLDRPPVRWLRFAPHELEVTGARAWVLTRDGYEFGVRVLGEPRRHKFEGAIDWSKGIESLDKPAVGTAVPVCSEIRWYRWRRTGEAPQQVEWYPTEFVWLE
ncbi:hypothetical protein Lesp01_84950 [Lentzea sp. NBRC 102530]|nr:hypothetical protein Lesp01_84950 [Lentzea sp. NBRC 102530]